MEKNYISYQIKNNTKSMQLIKCKNGRLLTKLIYTIPGLKNKIYIMSFKDDENKKSQYDTIMLDPTNQWDAQTMSELDAFIDNPLNTAPDGSKYIIK